MASAISGAAGATGGTSGLIRLTVGDTSQMKTNSTALITGSVAKSSIGNAALAAAINSNGRGTNPQTITIIDSTHVDLQGTSWNNSTMSYSGGGVLYDVCPFGFSGNASNPTGSGSGFSVNVTQLSNNTIASSGCSGTNNRLDPEGTGSPCTFTDPNRTAGSYYATGGVGMGGSTWTPTTTATFTGVIDSGGTLTATAITGTIGLGDAITFSGQTTADYIKWSAANDTGAGHCAGPALCTGTGTNSGGTYGMAGSKSITSRGMSDYAAESLVTLEYGQSKKTWNPALGACTINNYFRAAFGIAAVTCPPGG